MKRRDFCRLGVAAGAATLLPARRLRSSPNDAPAGAELRAVKLSGAETTIERSAVSGLAREPERNAARSGRPNPPPSVRPRLHPFDPTVIAGTVAFPPAQTRDLIEFYARLITHAPRELSIDLGVGGLQDKTPGARLNVVYSGEAKSAGKVLEPVQRFGKPLQNTIRSQSYLAVQTWFDPPPVDPMHHYLKGGFVSEYTAGLVEALTEFRPDKQTSIYFQNANGAVADIQQTATAFSHRHTIANMLLCEWQERSQDEPGRAAARATWESLAPFTDGYYVNLNDADPKGTDSNYGPNSSRLAELKKRYDGQNLFRLNSNIKPA